MQGSKRIVKSIYYGKKLAKCIALYRACGLALEKGLHRNVVVREDVNPRLCGAYRTLGSPRRGKIGDYEIPFPPCMRCHIVAYEDRLEVHVDRVSPRCDPLVHLAVDATKIFTIGSTLIALLLTWIAGQGVVACFLASMATYIISRLG